MRYLVVSDIHGGAFSCEFIKNKFDTGSFDKILCLGDVLYHGPRNDLFDDYKPKTCIPILNSLKNDIICVKGNCEAEVDQMVLEFDVSNNTRIIDLDEHKVLMNHGHHTVDDIIEENNIDILLQGHTHILKAEYIDNIWSLNPGSITLPKGGNPRTYAILDENSFAIYDLNDQLIKKINF